MKLKEGESIKTLCILGEDGEDNREYYRVQSAGAGEKFKG